MNIPKMTKGLVRSIKSSAKHAYDEETVGLCVSWFGLMADREFLLDRSTKAGTCRLSGYRDTGISSNSIVAIAYGIEKLKDQRMPSDHADIEACRNMWEKLPKHRKTKDAKQAMTRAEIVIDREYEKD